MASENIYDMFATNTDAETEGKWLTYGKVKFLVARAGGSNDAFTNTMAKAMRPHARRFKLGRMEAKEVNEIALEPFVDACLKGWENVRLRPKEGETEGALLPFNRTNAIQLLKDIPELYSQLMEDAQSLATFAPDDVEDIAKN